MYYILLLYSEREENFELLCFIVSLVMLLCRCFFPAYRPRRRRYRFLAEYKTVPGASPRGGLGWTCPPHFSQRSFLRLMQIRWVFTREEGVGVGHGLELAKYGELSKFAASVEHQKLKGFQLQGWALTPDQGLCPWTPLGALPPDPVIGSRSARLPCMSTPHFWPGNAPERSSFILWVLCTCL